MENRQLEGKVYIFQNFIVKIIPKTKYCVNLRYFSNGCNAASVEITLRDARTLRDTLNKILCDK